MDENKLISQKPEDIFEERAEIETNISTVAKLALKLTALLDIEDPDPNLVRLVDTVKDVQVKSEECAKDLQRKINQSETVRKSKLDVLRIPDDVPCDLHVDIKELKSAVGPLNSQTSPHIKFWFEKLFAYGKGPKYGHEQYKAALGVLVEDEILDQYMALRDETFSYIAHWLYDVHHQADTASDLEVKLKSFIRKKNEKIKATMKRYEALARSLDSFYPPEQQTYNKSNNKIKVLMDYMVNPAKSKLETWRLSRLDSGFYSPFSLVLEKATELEVKHKCIPTENIELSTIDINAAHVREFKRKNSADVIKKTKSKFKQRQQENRDRKMNEKRLLDNVDPTRATSAKPSFYADRNANAPSQSNPNQNFQNSKQNVQKQNFRSKSDVNQKFSYQNDQQKLAEAKKLSHMAANKGARPKFKNDQKYVPNLQYGQGPSKRFPQTNMPPNAKPYKPGSLLNRPVVKHFFCLRCGVPKNKDGKTEFIGSDHQTAYCKVYEQFNAFGCSICLSRNIDAKHYPSECKQKASP